MRMFLESTFMLLLCIACPFQAVGSGKDAAAGQPSRVSPPPPYIFSLGGLEADQLGRIKKIPGVQVAILKKGRIQMQWKPGTGKNWIKGTQQIYDFLAIKDKLGNTNWTHGGAIAGRAGTIISNTKGHVSFGMMFNDRKTNRNEIMTIRCWNQGLKGQIEHEMLRNVSGTKVSIEKCGDGYVIVSRGGRGTFVVWQISDQMFVRIDNSYDKEMVAAYVQRLGSIIPKDYNVDVEKWIENEIRWRIQKLDWAFDRQENHSTPIVWMLTSDLTTTFPDAFKLYGLPEANAVCQKVWPFLNVYRQFLWANRKNFEYDDGSRGFVLKKKNLYDPAHPQQLPKELKGPPKPKEAEVVPPKRNTEVQVYIAGRPLREWYKDLDAKDPKVVVEACGVMALAGKSATEATPKLEELSKSTNLDIAKAAKYALKKQK